MKFPQEGKRVRNIGPAFWPPHHTKIGRLGRPQHYTHHGSKSDTTQRDRQMMFMSLSQGLERVLARQEKGVPSS